MKKVLPSISKMVRNLSYFGSNEDIMRALHCGPDKIIKYSQLKEYSSLIDLLPGRVDYKIILLESNKNVGHWVCVIRVEDTVECFNSYGVTIDSEFKYIPDWIERMLGESKRYLSDLIKTAPKGITVVSNNVILQQDNPAIATCSRWVIFRIEMAKMGYNLQQFIQFIESVYSKSDLSLDELVVGWVPFVADRRPI